MLTRRMVDQILPTTVWPIGLLVACLALEAGMLRIGIDDLDEGYFLEQAARVLHGQVPYKDFESLYTPGLVSLHAGLFWLLGGASLLPPRALALVARAGLVLATSAITRPFVRNPLWAAVPGVILLVGIDDAPVRWEPHPGWLSSLFAVLAAWCLMHRPSAGWLAAAGAAAALAYLFKQNTGVFILVAMVIWCGPRRAALPLAVFVGLTLLWLVPLALVVGDLSRLGVLIGAVNEASLFAAPEPALLIPLSALLGGLWLLRRDSHPGLRWLLLAGVALFVTEFPRMDTLHLVWSAPLLLAVGAIALDRLPRTTRLLALACTALLLAPTWTSRATYLLQPRAAVAGVEAPVATASALQGVLAEIQDRTAPGEPIFVYPTSPLLYVLSDRPNPTRFDHLNPGAAGAPQIDGVLADLQRSQVRLVVISDFWERAWGLPGTGANAALEDWLATRYTQVGQDGTYRLLASDL
jgi:hypothetical protein